MKRSSVRPFIYSVPQQQRRAAGLLLSTPRAGDIDRQRAPALSSKCGWCYVDSRCRRLNIDSFERRVILSGVRFKTSIGINESVVVVGQHRKSQPDGFTVRVPVSRVIINQKFNRPGRMLTSDIMLLKLAHPVDFNDAVSPVCLPSLFQVLPSGKRCFSSGWGNLRSK